MYKIKEELKNKDLKIRGVLFEKDIFNRDIETLTSMLDSNPDLIPYMVESEDADNKAQIISLNKQVDELSNSEKTIKELKDKLKKSEKALKDKSNDFDKAYNNSTELSIKLNDVTTLNDELLASNVLLTSQLQDCQGQ